LSSTIVFDPVEFMPTRTPLGLDLLGLSVMTIDWGDAEVELFLVRQRRGEIPSDRHPPNRKATIGLKAAPTGSVSLAEAAYKLQQKLGLIQEEGGWLRRDMDIRGGFLQSVACPVLSVDFGGLHGWLMEHRQTADEIQIALTIGPTFYGVNEREGTLLEETVNRELIWTLKKIAGSAPGLIRNQITNKNASASFLGLISAMESRDYPGSATAETTAHLAYECEKLTRLGGATETERTEDSGKVVRATPVYQWQAFLGSEIPGVGHMTHIGPRKIMVRTYIEEPTQMRFRLEYRTTGFGVWEKGPIVEPETTGAGWTILDLGEVRIESALLGAQRWEFRITARVKEAEFVGSVVDFDRLWVIPLEQCLAVSTPFRYTSPTSLTVLDEFNQSPANENLTGKKDEKSHTYLNLTNGDADDFKTNAGTVIRTTLNDTGTLL
jgi:hypothetical protein